MGFCMNSKDESYGRKASFTYFFAILSNTVAKDVAMIFFWGRQCEVATPMLLALY